MDIPANRPSKSTSFKASKAWPCMVIVCWLLVLMGWGFSSPAGSDPDSPFHANSTWCSHGFRQNFCEQPDASLSELTPPVVLTPKMVTGLSCFAFNPETSGACENLTLQDREMVPNQVNNLSNLYPKGYYWFNGFFTSDNIYTYVNFGRLVNIGLFIAMLVGIFYCGGRRLLRNVSVALLLTTVPLGMFTVASNNPSSWAITGTIGFYVFSYCYIKLQDLTKKIFAFFFMMLCVAVVASARLDALIYITVIAVLFLVTAFNKIRSKEFGLYAVLTSVILFAAAFTFFSIDQGSALASGLSLDSNFNRPINDVVFNNLTNVPGLFFAIFGWGGYGGGMGWMDTSVPPLGFLSLGLVASLVLVTTMINRHRFSKFRILALTGFAVMVVFSMLYLDRAFVGENVQTRYVLPLISVIACELLFDSSPIRHRRKIKTVIIVLYVVGFGTALHTNMRRYITGTDILDFNLNTQIEWWRAPINPNLYFLFVVGIFTLLTLLLFWPSEIVDRLDSDDSSTTRLHH